MNQRTKQQMGLEQDLQGGFTWNPDENRFRDLHPLSYEAKAANALAWLGAVDSDGLFEGEKLVNRSEVAVFLLRVRFPAGIPETNYIRFTDVQRGQWYTNYVMSLPPKIEGYSDNSYRPGNPVRTVEFLKMLALTFGLEEDLPHIYEDVPLDAWYSPYAGIAIHYDLFPYRSRTELLPGSTLTRNDVAIALYQVLTRFSGQVAQTQSSEGGIPPEKLEE